MKKHLKRSLVLLVLTLLMAAGMPLAAFAAQKPSQVITARNIKVSYGSKPFYLNAKLTQGDGRLSYKSGNDSVAQVKTETSP